MNYPKFLAGVCTRKGIKVKIFAPHSRHVPYNACPRRGVSFVAPARIGDEPKENEPMKRAIRIAILIIGLVGTFVAAAAPLVPAADGGPLLLCPPGNTHCKSTLPT